MLVLSLFVDPSNFYSIRQQTAFNLVGSHKHTAHYYMTIFCGAFF